MNKSAVKTLVEHLKEVYTLPQGKKEDNVQQNYEQLKNKMRKRYRNPWKANGIVHESCKIDRLPAGDLDNWEILRINMAQRSYDHRHSNFVIILEEMKISSVSK